MTDKGSAPKPGKLQTGLAPEITITIQNPADAERILSPARRRVLEAAREEPLGVMQLARRLKRDARAVSRDVDLLEKHKVLNSGYEPNPGHGFRRVVRPAAARIRLVVTV
jgi:predicted transcriptional regulator